MIGRRSETLRLGSQDLQANAGGDQQEGDQSSRLPTAVMTAPEHGMVAVGFNSGEVRIAWTMGESRR